MKWFNEKEFRCRCCGRLPDEAKKNVEALVSAILDPVREKLGSAITVNSGYRCELHNARVGGVRGSQHLVGQAADVTCTDVSRLKALIRKNGKFDQLIDYGSFLHVSYKRFGPNRHQVLTKIGI